MRSLKVLRRATDSVAGDDADAIPFVAWLSRKVMSDDAAVAGPRPVVAAKTRPLQSTIWRPVFWTSFTLMTASALVTAGAGGASLVMAEEAKRDASAASALRDLGPRTADVANGALYATAGLAAATTALFFLPAEEEVTQ
jgi:hypothetical protein